MHRSNKNVLQDENDDNDVAIAATMTHAARPRTSTHVGHAFDAQPSAHIRRRLR
jgi:hypothetical protein